MKTKTNKVQTHSIYRVTILDVLYNIHLLKNGRKSTTCKIRWVNPANGNTQVSYGSTVCNPCDTYNEEIGKRIAESRAKSRMYNDYCHFIYNFSKKVIGKHNKLAFAEQDHLTDIINNQIK